MVRISPVRGAALVLLACSVTACSSGSQSVVPRVVAAEPTAAATAPVTISVIIPPKTQAARGATYISPSAQSMSIAVNGRRPADFNLTAGSPNCMTGPPLSCTASMTVPMGPDTFIVKLYDAVGGSGGTGVVLAANTVLATMGPGSNTLPLTLGGVISSISLSLATSSLAAGAVASTNLTVTARDAVSNIIVGPGAFADAAGNPQSIVLTTTQNQPAVVAPYTAGAATVSTPALTNPGSIVSVNYDGKALISTQITATTTGATPVTPVSTTLTLIPTVYEYALPGGSGPLGMTVGPDKQIWMTVSAGGIPSIGHFPAVGPGGTLSLTTFPTPLTDAGYGPLYLAAGSDGNVWYTDWNFAIFRAPVNAMFVTDSVQFTVPNNKPSGIIDGGDGNMYFDYSYFVGPAYIPLTSIPGIVTPTDFAIGGSSGVPIIGPDKRIWTTAGQGGCCFVPSIVALPTGVSTNMSTSTFTPGVNVNSVAVGGDGNIWYSEPGANQIGYIAPTATAVGQRVDLPLGGPFTPTSIVGGPDGAIYFIDIGTNKIGRVPTTATPGNVGLAEFPCPAGPTGFYQIIAGPDGNLWFNETTPTPMVAKLAI